MSSASNWREPVIRPRDLDEARSRKYYLAAGVAAALLAMLGALGAMLYFLTPFHTPRFLPLVLHEYEAQLPLRAWARRDGEALRDLQWTRKPDTLPSQQRDLLRGELQLLDDAGSREPLVVFLSAYVVPNAQGVPCVLAVDDALNDSARWLPLADLLAMVGKAPARHKLLLLDVHQPLVLPQQGFLRSDVAAQVRPVVEKAVEGSANLQVLCACSPGQVSWTSEELGHSVFAYFVARGLRGRADGALPDGKRDKRVSAAELVAYVRRHVDAWVAQNLGERQTPYAVGAVDDFPVTLVRPEPDEEPALPEAYPGWLKAGWQRHDRWWAQGVHRLSPRLVADLGAALLQAELRWRGGLGEDRARSDLDARLAQLERERGRLPAPERGPPVNPAEALARDPEQKKLADEEAANVLRQLAAVRDKLAKEKPEEARVKQLEQEVEAFAKKFKGKPLALAWLACEAPCEHPFGPGGLKLLADLLDQAEITGFDEVAFLRRLAKRANERPADVVPAVAQVAMQTAREAARAKTASEEAGRWIEVLLARAAAQRQAAEKLLFEAGRPWDQAAGPALRKALDLYRELNRDRGIVEEACLWRDEAMALLPGFAGAVEIDDRLTPAWLRAAATTRELRAALEAPRRQPGAERTDSIDRLEDLTERLRKGPNSLHSLRQPLSPSGFRALIQQRNADGLTDARTYQALLASTWPKAEQREKLWSEYRAHSRRRHQAFLEAADAPRPRLAEPPAWDAEKGGQALLRNDLTRARQSLSRLRLLTRNDTEAPGRALADVEAKPEDPQRWRALAEEVRQAWAKARSEASGAERPRTPGETR